MKFLKFFLHLILAVFLTVLTQIGGILYLLSLIVFRKKGKRKYLYFLGIYLLFTFLIVPYSAPLLGREKITNSEILRPRNYFYVLTNRNYVTPKLNKTLQTVADQFSKNHPGIQLVYLDANFPFFDGFPLLPHLSHNDGKKIDITFVYEEAGQLSNKKPSLSGYGVYEGPKPHETNQPQVCKNKGHWQYDFPKYLTLGQWSQDLQFSNRGNKELINRILQQPRTSKVFIEPHLKQRLGLGHSKLRYHGCRAVRHDDHIHLQIQ